jgi:hypothetical protein
MDGSQVLRVEFLQPAETLHLDDIISLVQAFMLPAFTTEAFCSLPLNPISS